MNKTLLLLIAFYFSTASHATGINENPSKKPQLTEEEYIIWCLHIITHPKSTSQQLDDVCNNITKTLTSVHENQNPIITDATTIYRTKLLLLKYRAKKRLAELYAP